MQWLLNWYKQHLFNSCVTAMGRREERGRKKAKAFAVFINHFVITAYCTVLFKGRSGEPMDCLI